MVLLLCLNVLQYGLKLTEAHRKRAISALPEKAAIASVKSFDPFRGRFLYLLIKSAWERVRGNVVTMWT